MDKSLKSDPNAAEGKRKGGICACRDAMGGWMEKVLSLEKDPKRFLLKKTVTKAGGRKIDPAENVNERRDRGGVEDGVIWQDDGRQ